MTVSFTPGSGHIPSSSAQGSRPKMAHPQPANLFPFRRILMTVAACLTCLVGCQTPRHVEFQQVRQGMEKDLVIEAAGGPEKSRRWQGKDRWIYEFSETPEGPQTREVHFEDGRAVYVGTKIPPVISAEEQDRINEKENRAEEEALSQERIEWEKRHGVARLRKVPNGKKGTKIVPAFELDEQYRKIQQQYHGTTDRDAEKNKRAPTFEVVQ
jgi:hypothetical protein